MPEWRWTAPSPSFAGMPAADDDGVAATFGHHGLVLLTARGEVRWQVDFDRLRDVAPALGRDVVMATTEHGVVAFDRSTGLTRWVSTIGGDERPTAPILTADTVAFLTWEGSAFGFDRTNGRQRWRVALPAAAIAAPVTDGATVAAVFDDGSPGVIAIDAATGATRWTRPLPAGAVSGPALVAAAGRTLVVAIGGDRRIHALDLADGNERWVTDTAGGAGSYEVPPVAVGDDVVIADRLTGVTRVAAGSGASRWRITGPGALERGGPVVLPGGEVVLPIDEGGIYFVGDGGRRPHVYTTDGRVSGLARTGKVLVVATREGAQNGLAAFTAR